LLLPGWYKCLLRSEGNAGAFGMGYTVQHGAHYLVTAVVSSCAEFITRP
jgi:hypothetical protein